MSALFSSLRRIASDLRDRAWPTILRLRQYFRAAVQVPGITITVLAAVFPVVLPFVLPFFAQGFFAALPYILSLLALLAILIFISGAIAIVTADPESYARLLVAGRPAKEVLFSLARHSVRTCRRTLKHAPDARDLLAELQARTENKTAAQVDPLTLPERKRIDRLVESIRPLVQKQHKPFLRIEAIKLLASQELGIPQRRLCDHLLQYSPQLHRERLQKYLEQWEQLNALEIGSDADLSRYQGLIRQNLSFLNNLERRIGYQQQILENRDLHPYVVQFASMHSTSGSLQTYAEALRDIAVKGRQMLDRAGNNPRQQDQVAEKTEIRFRFLHRKQRAHPGFDLHILLRRAIALFNRPDRDLALLLQLLDDGNATEVKNLILERRLTALSILPADLARLVAANREEICKEFQEIYKEWFKGPQGSRYIVSHGYSRTVLSVLKATLPREAAPQALLEQPRIFFLFGEEGSFDTRVMEYEIKQDRGLRHVRLGAGGDSHLLGLLSEGDAVLILLGAECFDEDLRMVHPRGIVSALGEFLEELENRGVRALVAVVAESYKRHEISLATDTNFYGQHFDRIDLYPKDLIHLVVTDKGTLPEDWRKVLQARIKARGTSFWSRTRRKKKPLGGEAAAQHGRSGSP